MSPSAISDLTQALHSAKSGDLTENPSWKELDVSTMVKTRVAESDQKPVPTLQDPVRTTQKYTTAHMVQALWTIEKGWGAPEMSPYGRIALD